MIGEWIRDWVDRMPGCALRHPLLLTAVQFNREIARERIRSSRRSFPFCILTLELNEALQRRRRSKMLVRLMHRNLRMTDHKAVLGPGKYAVLLVDTPEMGGRSALDRISQLAEQSNLRVTTHLRVHDPEGFDSDDRFFGNGRRRHEDEAGGRWIPVEPKVEVSSEEPLVPPPEIRMSIKRLVDIVGASFGLLLSAPILSVAMWVIRRHDSGPAIFKQTREGYRGKPFTIYKLRTMAVDAEQIQATLMDKNRRDGPAFKLENDPRVTPIGNFLRRTCLDELPQLWNVLRGEMSLVGPRPLPWHESRACCAWHRRRLEVRPGLTCYWQINKASVDTFDDWMRLDLRYVDEIGFVRDLRLIAQTVTVPMSGRGSE